MSEKELFIMALLQGHIYFKTRDGKIHKGFITKYETEIYNYCQSLEVAYGVHYYFNHLVNGEKELWIEDDEELIKNYKNHWAYEKCFNCGLTLHSYNLDYEHYRKTWSLNKEELE